MNFRDWYYRVNAKAFICLLLYMISINSNCIGQTIDSIVVSESRCAYSGTANLIVSGGVPPYTYSIVVGPVLRPNQSSAYFDYLPAGLYQFKVIDSVGNSNYLYKQITGNYQSPIFNSRYKEPACNTNDGYIYINPSLNTTRMPLKYSAIRVSGDSPIPDSVLINSSDSFKTGLKAGTYLLQIKDSCNNIQSRFVNLVRSVQNNWSLNGIELCRTPNYSPIKNICDSVRLKVEYNAGSGGSFFAIPIFIIIKNQRTGLKIDSMVIKNTTNSVISRMIFNPNLDTCTLIAKDVCGRIFTYTVKPPAFNALQFYGIKASGCNSTNIDLLVQYNCNLAGWNWVDWPNLGTHNTSLPKFPLIKYRITSGPVLRNWQDSGDFRDIPPGVYTEEAKDTCGKILTETKSINMPPKFKIIETHIIPSNCIIGKCGLSVVRLNNGTPGMIYKGKLISGPVGQSFPILIRLNAVNPNYYTTNWPTAFSKDSLLPGIYKLVISDTCGNTDTTTVNCNKPLFIDKKIWVSSGCGSQDGFIKIYLKSNLYSGGIGRLYNSNNTVLATDQINNIYNDSLIIIQLSNMSTNVKLVWKFSSSCQAWIDTIVIPNYQQPKIKKIDYVKCSVGNLIIAVSPDISVGKPPFKYEIISGPVTRPVQASRFFTGLPLGSYVVRIIDSCLNTHTAAVSGNPWTGGVIVTGINKCMWWGDSVKLEMDSLFQANYFWTDLKTGQIKSNMSVWKIPSFQANDTGRFCANFNIGTCSSVLDTIHLYRPICYDTGKIGGNVWFDSDIDGFLDSAELRLFGAKSYLFDISRNRIVDSVRSDSWGKYKFKSLPAGRFRVKILYPGYWPTYKNLGKDSFKDSDIDTINNITNILCLGKNAENLSVNAGFSPTQLLTKNEMKIKLLTCESSKITFLISGLSAQIFDSFILICYDCISNGIINKYQINLDSVKIGNSNLLQIPAAKGCIRCQLIGYNYLGSKYLSNSVCCKGNSKIYFWPNPVIDVIHINKFQYRPINVEIFSVNGICVLYRKMVDLDGINLSSLPAGIYLLHFFNDEIEFWNKFQKQ